MNFNHLLGIIGLATSALAAQRPTAEAAEGLRATVATDGRRDRLRRVHHGPGRNGEGRVRLEKRHVRALPGDHRRDGLSRGRHDGVRARLQEGRRLLARRVDGKQSSVLAVLDLFFVTSQR